MNKTFEIELRKQYEEAKQSAELLPHLEYLIKFYEKKNINGSDKIQEEVKTILTDRPKQVEFKKQKTDDQILFIIRYVFERPVRLKELENKVHEMSGRKSKVRDVVRDMAQSEVLIKGKYNGSLQHTYISVPEMFDASKMDFKSELRPTDIPNGAVLVIDKIEEKSHATESV